MECLLFTVAEIKADKPAMKFGVYDDIETESGTGLSLKTKTMVKYKGDISTYPSTLARCY